MKGRGRWVRVNNWLHLIGIGFAAAEGLAKLNAEVHIICRDNVRAEEAKNKLVEASKNEKIFVHTCDMSSYSEIRAFSEVFCSEVPRPDVLVNNAGLMPKTLTLSSEGNEIITATMLGGTMLLTDRLVPVLQKSSDPRVINVSSGGAYSGTQLYAHE